MREEIAFGLFVTGFYTTDDTGTGRSRTVLMKRGPGRENLPVQLTPPRPYRKFLRPPCGRSMRIYALNEKKSTGSPHETAFAVLRFFTAFRRMPPARPAAIRRAFLLEELS